MISPAAKSPSSFCECRGDSTSPTNLHSTLIQNTHAAAWTKMFSSRVSEGSILQKNRKISIKIESSAIKCYGKVSSFIPSQPFREGICRWHSHFLNKLSEKSEIAEGNLYQAIDEHFVWKSFILLEEAFCLQYSFVKNTRHMVVWVSVATQSDWCKFCVWHETSYKANDANGFSANSTLQVTFTALETADEKVLG